MRAFVWIFFFQIIRRRPERGRIRGPGHRLDELEKFGKNGCLPGGSDQLIAHDRDGAGQPVAGLMGGTVSYTDDACARAI
jgi:hypothetical protein